MGGLFLPHVDGLHVLLLKELVQLKMACFVLLSTLPCQGSALLVSHPRCSLSSAVSS